MATGRRAGDRAGCAGRGSFPSAARRKAERLGSRGSYCNACALASPLEGPKRSTWHSKPLLIFASGLARRPACQHVMVPLCGVSGEACVARSNFTTYMPPPHALSGDVRHTMGLACASPWQQVGVKSCQEDRPQDASASLCAFDV